VGGGGWFVCGICGGYRKVGALVGGGWRFWRGVFVGGVFLFGGWEIVVFGGGFVVFVCVGVGCGCCGGFGFFDGVWFCYLGCSGFLGVLF